MAFTSETAKIIGDKGRQSRYGKKGGGASSASRRKSLETDVWIVYSSPLEKNFSSPRRQRLQSLMRDNLPQFHQLMLKVLPDAPKVLGEEKGPEAQASQEQTERVREQLNELLLETGCVREIANG